MNNNNQNNNVDEQSKSFFTDGSFNWTRSKDDVLNELMNKIDKPGKKRIVNLNRKLIQFGIAAAILVLIGLPAFLSLYTVRVTTPAGIHQKVTLPDGSTVFLNACSEISYHPYLWRFEREVHLVGEAYFEVEKGKKFLVISNKATTEVLGTSFNIFSREDIYTVTCLTGSVKVTSQTKEEVILKPDSKTELMKNGNLTVKRSIESYADISWKSNIFVFNSKPVYLVFKEIERQYDVNISAKIDSFALYTGNFTKKQNVENVLGYICPALDLEFSKTGENTYSIIKRE